MTWVIVLIAIGLWLLFSDFSTAPDYNRGLDIGATLYPVSVFRNGTSSTNFDKSQGKCGLLELFKNTTLTPYRYVVVCEPFESGSKTAHNFGSSTATITLNTTALISTYESWSSEVISGMWDRSYLNSSVVEVPSQRGQNPAGTTTWRASPALSSTTPESATPTSSPSRTSCASQPLDLDLLQYYESRVEWLYRSAVLNVILSICLTITICMLLKGDKSMWGHHTGETYEAVITDENEKTMPV